MADDQTNSTEVTNSEVTTTADTGGSDATTGTATVDTSADDAGTVLGAATTDAGTGDEATGKPEASKDGADDASAPVVPEKYELSLTVKDAEGKDQPIEIDPALLEAATPVLKDLGLTNEQANKVAGLVPQVQQRLIQQQADDFEKTKTQWAKDAAADEEIGGKNWKESQTFAAKALDHFGAPKDSDFRKLLNDTGLGNHPEMIRIFRKVGAALGEEQAFAQGDGRAVKRDRLEEIYPDDVPTKVK